DPWTEVIAIIEAFHGTDNLCPAQAGILNGGQLMTHLIAHFVYREVLVLFQVGLKLGPWIGMSYRDLNSFAVKLLGKLEGALDGLGRLPWQSDDKITVYHDVQPLAVFHISKSVFMALCSPCFPAQSPCQATGAPCPGWQSRTGLAGGTWASGESLGAVD